MITTTRIQDDRRECDGLTVFGHGYAPQAAMLVARPEPRDRRAPCLSETTVKSHVRRILRMLRAVRRAGAVDRHHRPASE